MSSIDQIPSLLTEEVLPLCWEVYGVSPASKLLPTCVG